MQLRLHYVMLSRWCGPPRELALQRLCPFDCFHAAGALPRTILLISGTAQSALSMITVRPATPPAARHSAQIQD